MKSLFSISLSCMLLSQFFAYGQLKDQLNALTGSLNKLNNALQGKEVDKRRVQLNQLINEFKEQERVSFSDYKKFEDIFEDLHDDLGFEDEKDPEFKKYIFWGTYAFLSVFYNKYALDDEGEFRGPTALLNAAKKDEEEEQYFFEADPLTAKKIYTEVENGIEILARALKERQFQNKKVQELYNSLKVWQRKTENLLKIGS